MRPTAMVIGWMYLVGIATGIAGTTIFWAYKPAPSEWETLAHTNLAGWNKCLDDLEHELRR